MLDKQTLAARIREAVEGSSHTQESVARAFDVTVQAVSGWMRTGKIDKRKLPKLANLTNRPLTFFMPGAEADGFHAQPPALDVDTVMEVAAAVAQALQELQGGQERLVVDFTQPDNASRFVRAYKIAQQLAPQDRHGPALGVKVMNLVSMQGAAQRDGQGQDQRHRGKAAGGGTRKRR